MAWPSARFKTAANGGTWTPTDMNGVQDQYVRSAGLSRDDLETAITEGLGLTTTASGHGGAAVRRGKSIIAGEGQRTNVAYGALDAGVAPGPDQVSGIVLPSDGLIAVVYQAFWRPAVVSTTIKAAVFLGANQLKISSSGEPVLAEEASSGGSTLGWGAVGTGALGMAGQAGATGNTVSHASTGAVASGHENQNKPGVLYIAAAAGTYTVSVQFKATADAVIVKARKLWVWTLGF